METTDRITSVERDDGDELAVVVKSAKSTIGWLLAHVATDPMSKYDVYHTDRAFEFHDDPPLDAVESGERSLHERITWVGPQPITDAADAYLQERYALALYSAGRRPSLNEATAYGVRDGWDALSVVHRALLDSNEMF